MLERFEEFPVKKGELDLLSAKNKISISGIVPSPLRETYLRSALDSDWHWHSALVLRAGKSITASCLVN